MKKFLAAAFMPLALAGTAFAQEVIIDTNPPVDTRSPEDQARWPLIPTAPPCTQSCLTARVVPSPEYAEFIMPPAGSLVRIPLATDEGNVGFFTLAGIEDESPIRLLEASSMVRTVSGSNLEARFGEHRLRGTFFRVTCEFPSDIPENRRHTIDFLGGGTNHREAVRVEPDPESAGDFIQWERIRGYSVEARTNVFSCYVEYLPPADAHPLTPQ